MTTTSEFKADSNLGDSLNQYTGLTVLEADGAEELASVIKSIKFPIDIISIVTKGSRFYAFIKSSRPIKKKVK